MYTNNKSAVKMGKNIYFFPQGCWVIQGCSLSYTHFFVFFLLNFTHFSPQFCGIQLLSHRYNSHMGSGEMKVESHASSDTQHNQAALLLNTARIQPGSQPHQCVGGNTVHLATLVSAHCARPATGVAGAQ